MAQYPKEIGRLWAFCFFCVLINAADERGRRFILEQGSSGSILINLQPIGVNSTDNNNVNTLSLDHLQECQRYTEYNDLIHLQNNMECYSMDTVFPKLRALHERSQIHGPRCMHDVIEKLKTYFTTYHNSKRCTCAGYVVYHPERYHNVHETCKNRNNHFDVVYAHLFGNDSNHVQCIPHDRALVHLGSLPIHLNNYLDCQWEIINHYTTIIDVNGITCSCFQESHTCTKAAAISTLLFGIKQANPGAGNCHSETFDHMAPEALVMNMCNVTGHTETWTRGQNVMSVCERIPLYTPVATFFDGKFSSQGGLAGIFVGCLQGGFKMIVQECDKNITVMHVVTGGHFLLDPVNYSIIM